MVQAARAAAVPVAVSEFERAVDAITALWGNLRRWHSNEIAVFITVNGIVWCSTASKYRYDRLMAAHADDLHGYYTRAATLPDLMQELLSAAREKGLTI